jgi:cell division protein FtsW
LAFVFTSQRRFNRFTAFLDITAHKDYLSYQVYQAMIGMATGGVSGTGVGSGPSKWGYLPLAHSDFIFAVIGEELGLIGVVAVIGSFLLLTYFGVQVALAARDRFGTLLAGGIVAWLAVQAVINIGGVSGLMPVTGLTLPFVSSGGSSLFACMTAAGLLLNVARHVR